jgi:gliding motility-associated-like protein
LGFSCKYFLAFALAVSVFFTFSQNETRKWYFGHRGALDFMTSPPTSVANGSMYTHEGCASVADNAGNLLFYTNGVTIWNKQHQVMANGTGLFGENTSSQSALIVKQPGSASIYFVFTTDGATNGLNYSVVDMSLAAGLGSVTAKNNLVAASSSEHLCATRHCNGKDVWVMSHRAFTDDYRATLVTSSGVDTTAILSTIGTPFYNLTGCMKISPNGRKLGAAIYSPPSFEIYDFDPATGLLSNSLSLTVPTSPYGCEFSPDGTKFYGTLWGPTNVTNKLWQWDLCAGTDQAVAASGTSFYSGQTGQLQLAPDGKIYQARATVRSVRMGEISMEQLFGETALGVIHNPNAPASAVNYNNTGQSVAPAISIFGLPNFVSGFNRTPVAQFTYSTNPSVSCVKAFLAAPPLISNSCSANGYTVNNLKWFFGDPASGPADSSTLVNPDHAYPDIGTYNVRLILYNSCGGVIDTLRQVVVIGGGLSKNPSTYTLCTGQSMTLAAAAASSYTWSTGATTSSIVVTPKSNTTYSVGFTDAFGCPRKSVQTVTVYPVPSVTVTGKDSLCEGRPFQFKASGTVSYSWSTGSTYATINVTPAVTTVYTVTGTNINGCSVEKVVTAFVKSAPIPVISANTIVCEGAVATASAYAPGNPSFYWTTGKYGTTFTIVPNWNMYVYAATATYSNGCTRFSRVRFKIVFPPTVSVAGVPTVCAGSAVTQTARGASTYSWSDGQTANPAYLSPMADAIYTVTGVDTNKCMNTATVAIKVKPTPNPIMSPNVSMCEGGTATLLATGGGQYIWRKDTSLLITGTSLIIVSPTVSSIYSVTASYEECTSSTRTIGVNINPRPRPWAGNDTIFNPGEAMFITVTGNGHVTWTGGNDIECPQCPTTRIFPVTKTCYSVLVISDSACYATDEVCVDLGMDVVFVPNAFTPNGDGLNDELRATGYGISDIKLTVYDRWGTRLFMGVNEGWNGSFNGRICQEGLYTWVLEFNSISGMRKQRTGVVSLMR